MTRKELNSAIYFQLPEIIRDERDYRIEQYRRLSGNYNINGTKELTDEEAVLVYYCLLENCNGEDVNFEHFACFDKNKKSHMQVLSLARQIGWLNGNFADLDRLGKFIQSERSPVQKPLVLMTAQETSKLITALKGILSHQISKA